MARVNNFIEQVQITDVVEENFINAITSFIKNPVNISNKELELDIVTSNEKGRSILFTRVFLHIISDNTSTEVKYDICGNNSFVNSTRTITKSNGRTRKEYNPNVICNLTEEEMLNSFKNKIIPKITSGINDSNFRKEMAHRYYNDDRRFLYKDGKFCPYVLNLLNNSKIQKARVLQMFDYIYSVLSELIKNNTLDEKIENIGNIYKINKKKLKSTSLLFVNSLYEYLIDDEVKLDKKDLINILKLMDSYNTNAKKIKFISILFSSLKYKRLGYMYLIEDTEARKSVRRFTKSSINAILALKSYLIVKRYIECIKQ